jgi:hypothetical protein
VLAARAPKIRTNQSKEKGIMDTRQKSLTAALVAAVPMALAVAAAHAESACKGLVEQQCANQPVCLWVKGYTRSDGRSVQGYCRSRGGKTSGRSSPPDRSGSAHHEVKEPAQSATREDGQTFGG